MAWFNVMDRDCRKRDEGVVGRRTLRIDDCGVESRDIREIDRRNENMVMSI